MRSPASMDTIQVELTDSCTLACSNCTRNVGHRTPFFITFDEFKKAIDSLNGFNGIAGFMGGEPTLHPRFFLSFANMLYLCDTSPRIIGPYGAYLP